MGKMKATISATGRAVPSTPAAQGFELKPHQEKLKAELKDRLLNMDFAAAELRIMAHLNAQADPPPLGKFVQVWSSQPRQYGKLEQVEHFGMLVHVLPAGQLPPAKLLALKGAGYTTNSRVSKYDRWTIQLMRMPKAHLRDWHITIAMNPLWSWSTVRIK